MIVHQQIHQRRKHARRKAHLIILLEPHNRILDPQHAQHGEHPSTQLRQQPPQRNVSLTTLCVSYKQRQLHHRLKLLLLRVTHELRHTRFIPQHHSALRALLRLSHHQHTLLGHVQHLQRVALRHRVIVHSHLHVTHVLITPCQRVQNLRLHLVQLVEQRAEEGVHLLAEQKAQVWLLATHTTILAEGEIRSISPDSVIRHLNVHRFVTHLQLHLALCYQRRRLHATLRHTILLPHTTLLHHTPPQQRLLLIHAPILVKLHVHPRRYNSLHAPIPTIHTDALQLGCEPRTRLPPKIRLREANRNYDITSASHHYTQ